MTAHPGRGDAGAGRQDSSEGTPVTSEERDRLHIYEIRVRGHLGTKMLRAFPAFDARPQGKDTLLTGRLPDQAAVYGVIAKLEALGLELLELRNGAAGTLSPSGEAPRDAGDPRGPGISRVRAGPRLRASDGGSLCTLQRSHRSTSFFYRCTPSFDFMKYPECRGAPAPDIPDRAARVTEVTGSTRCGGKRPLAPSDALTVGAGERLRGMGRGRETRTRSG